MEEAVAEAPAATPETMTQAAPVREAAVLVAEVLVAVVLALTRPPHLVGQRARRSALPGQTATRSNQACQ